MNNQSKQTPNLDMFHHVAIVNIRKDKIEQVELKPGIIKQFTISDAGNKITRAYLFQKDVFTEEQAEEWLKRRNVKFEWKREKSPVDKVKFNHLSVTNKGGHPIEKKPRRGRKKKEDKNSETIEG